MHWCPMDQHECQYQTWLVPSQTTCTSIEQYTLDINIGICIFLCEPSLALVFNYGIYTHNYVITLGSKPAGVRNYNATNY